MVSKINNEVFVQKMYKTKWFPKRLYNYKASNEKENERSIFFSKLNSVSALMRMYKIQSNVKK